MAEAERVMSEIEIDRREAERGKAKMHLLFKILSGRDRNYCSEMLLFRGIPEVSHLVVAFR